MNCKITLPTILYVICALLFTACQQEKPQYEPINSQQTPLAKVGSHTIYKEDVDAEIRELPEHFQQLSHSPKARKHVLQTLIRRSVLSQQAIVFGLDHEPLVHKRIKRSRDSILIEALRDWQLSRMPQSSEQEVSDYYQQHINNFTIPEQIHARHILLRKKKEAVKILKQLRYKKADFADLAARFSMDDSNKSRGGDLNWFPRGIMVKTFEKAAFKLKNIGDISQPIKTQYGWHIIELLGKRPIIQQPLAEVKGEILQILRQQELDTWIETLVEKSHVKILSNPQSEPDLQMPIK